MSTSLFSLIEKCGEQGLFALEENPDVLAAALLGGDQAALDKAATDIFLLRATHLRDGRTPNAARKQWFMVDSDGDSEPLLSLLTAALGAGTVPETLASLDPVHPDFALLKASLKTAKTPAQATAIRVNMERWRTMPRDLGERYVEIGRAH